MVHNPFSRFGKLEPGLVTFAKSMYQEEIARIPQIYPETNSSPLKIARAPKKNNRIPTIHFQGRTVSFRDGNNHYFKKCSSWVPFHSAVESFLPGSTNWGIPSSWTNLTSFSLFRGRFNHQNDPKCMVSSQNMGSCRVGFKKIYVYHGQKSLYWGWSSHL